MKKVKARIVFVVLALFTALYVFIFPIVYYRQVAAMVNEGWFEPIWLANIVFYMVSALLQVPLIVSWVNFYKSRYLRSIILILIPLITVIALESVPFVEDYVDEHEPSKMFEK